MSNGEHEMTEEEYLRRMKVETDKLPPEFAGYVERVAYDRGHYAGYEEVLEIASALVLDLSECVSAYCARVAAETASGQEEAA